MTMFKLCEFSQGSGLPERSERGIFSNVGKIQHGIRTPLYIHLVYKIQLIDAGFLLHSSRIFKLWRAGKGRIGAPFQMGGSSNRYQLATFQRLEPLGGDLFLLPSGGFNHA